MTQINNGGGIDNYCGTTTITSSAISSNTAWDGSGIYSGGDYVNSIITLATLNVMGSTISSNSGTREHSDCGIHMGRVGFDSFLFDDTKASPPGVSALGLTEDFSTSAPVSLYGATKLASEALALEYGYTYNLPVWINRCGVLAGAGQFGTAEQGIFSYWLHAHAQRRPLGFYGFGGRGLQVRDALHPNDLARIVIRQITDSDLTKPGGIFHVAGGSNNAMSMAQLTAWCDERFGRHPAVSNSANRPFDVPWVIMDSTKARQTFAWEPEMSLPQILNEIAEHVKTHPDWLSVTGA